MHNGRNIFGFPKKLATIHIERDGNSAHGWVERRGVRFVEIRAQLAAEMPQLPPMGPTFLFKAMPRADLTPGFDGPVLLVRQATDIALNKLGVGTAEVLLKHSDADPWAEVEIANVIVAYYLDSNNTMQPGQVVAEANPETFLPHFFKMTDFSTGA